MNGTPVSTSQFKELSEQLVLMHTQHANQKLLQTKHQLALLDEFADQSLARDAFQTAYRDWVETFSALDLLKTIASRADAERELLWFQVCELDAFDLQDGEFRQLDEEQRQLASSDTFLRITEQTLASLAGDETGGLISNSERLAADITQITNVHMGLQNTADLLNQASIALTEARHEIQHAHDQFDLDPERLQFVEDRLAQVFQLARKHKVEPEELVSHHQSLAARLTDIAEANDRIPMLEQEAAARETVANERAAELTRVRTIAAQQLSHEVTANFPSLGMEHAKLEIQLAHNDSLTATGAESLQFFFQPNWRVGR